MKKLLPIPLVTAPVLIGLMLNLNAQFSTAFAQGTAFTYQGQLNANSGPANGLYDMAFTLYATNTGGIALAGPVTNSAVGVTNGLFIITVNFGNVFSGASNWLQIAVSTNGANTFNTLMPRQQLTPVPYAITAENLNGTGLAGTYGNQVSFSNAANQFTGSFTGAGGNLTGLNASQLTAGAVPSAALTNAWKTTGNSGTAPGSNFIGTVDNQPLELRVNNQRGLRLEPGGSSNSVNVIGGWAGNGVAPGVIGATVSGGGAGNYFGLAFSNQVSAHFGTVSGGAVNFIQAGAVYANIAGGYENTIQSNAYSSTIFGGQQNTIQLSAYESTIGGGNLNVIETGTEQAFIGGGSDNTIEPGILDSFIGGGYFNLIQSNSWFATIAGGDNNTIQTNAGFSTISGGGGNQIQTTAHSATIAGGGANMILSNCTFAVIGGGLANVIDNDAVETTIAGGRMNTIETNAPDSVIGGGIGNTIQLFGGASVIAGGWGNVIQPGADTVNGQLATISGGYQNIASGYGTVVAGGYYNTANAIYATASGGEQNTASGQYATAGGGDVNAANGAYATISGGANNIASGYASTVCGGDGNTASGPDGSATVGGGFQNTASGDDSTVPGGYGNIASGPYSFAAGENAQAPYANTFVWSDGSAFAATENDQFAVRAGGGILLAGDVSMAGGATTYHNFSLSGGNAAGYLYGSYLALGDGIHLGYNWYYDNNGTGHISNSGGATSRVSVGYGYFGVYVGGVDAAPSTTRIYADTSGVSVYGTFNNYSDRNAKRDFAPVSSAQILEKVAQLPITEWSYKEDPKTRHVGPVAQDFYAAFNIGTDERHIAPIDEGGVALAAIKGLNQKLEEKDAEIQDLKSRLDKLEQLLNQQNGGGR
jgi:hypothetical protein